MFIFNSDFLCVFSSKLITAACLCVFIHLVQKVRSNEKQQDEEAVERAVIHSILV